MSLFTRHFSTFVAAAWVAASFGQAVKLPAKQGAPAADQDYAGAYDSAKQVTILGTVTGKVKGTPVGGFAEGIAILVRNSKGHVYSVDLGPAWYVADQATAIHMGDHVRVTGSPVTLSTGEKLVLARDVKKSGRTLTLRDTGGYPYWMAYRQGDYQVPGTNASNVISGQIVSNNPVTVEGQQELGYQIQTPNGLANVAVAPSWYLQNQPLPYGVGDNVIVSGMTPFTTGAIILAGGIYSSGNGVTTVLRPNGVPVWGGWQNGVITNH